MDYMFMVTYQLHDKDENYGVSNEYVRAESIGQAIRMIDEWLDDLMEKEKWSDYNITNVNVMPELH